MSTATVFVGKKLSEEEYVDDSFRERALQDAAHSIRANVDGIDILNQNLLFCSMTISGSAKAIAAVARFLEESGTGHMDTGAEHSVLKRGLV